MHKLNPTIALALFVAAIPSLWAVVAPFIGVTVGAATLIVVGFFVASGNDPKNKWRLLFGMWLGIPWGMMAVTFPGLTGWPKLTLYVTLFVLGGLAVLISSMPGIRNWVDTAAWLTGWAHFNRYLKLEWWSSEVWHDAIANCWCDACGYLYRWCSWPSLG
ncbi:DUF1097 domain-containing protein [Weissella cibaria]|uniref:DUF1097 domain-containing protein n=1 Tax=Weissella cibaria TaxID=137591 RepID=A0A0D1M131_9LACO|nr:DUF1097 domain-containing protein [Weissella cibaria]KIU21776.1 hypothetical protein QX99_00463 [Weissella cibaria]MDV8929451.1 DUF1097 domain-containing protein [Weissella cibaria]